MIDALRYEIGVVHRNFLQDTKQIRLYVPGKLLLCYHGDDLELAVAEDPKRFEEEDKTIGGKLGPDTVGVHLEDQDVETLVRYAREIRQLQTKQQFAASQLIRSVKK